MFSTFLCDLGVLRGQFLRVLRGRLIRALRGRARALVARLAQQLQLDELGLRGVDLLPRRRGVEPGAAVDFGERDPPAGAARPLRRRSRHRERHTGPG